MRVIVIGTGFVAQAYLRALHYREMAKNKKRQE